MDERIGQQGKEQHVESALNAETRKDIKVIRQKKGRRRERVRTRGENSGGEER